MRAEDATANTAGVHAAWRGCLAAVAGIAPGTGAYPDTAARYRDLAGHCPVAAAGGGLQAVPPGRREAQPRAGAPRVPGTGCGR